MWISVMLEIKKFAAHRSRSITLSKLLLLSDQPGIESGSCRSYALIHQEKAKIIKVLIDQTISIVTSRLRGKSAQDVPSAVECCFFDGA